MASGVRCVASSYILLHILSICTLSRAEFPDFGVIQDIAVDIGNKLADYLDEATGFETVGKLYQDEVPNMDLQPVQGENLVQEMADNLGKLLAKKVKALKKSVAWAEDRAKEYVWNDDLEISDVEYVDSKNMEINMSDPAFQDSVTYQQVVSFENSSVHIPVEIYKGMIQILNGLSWTSSLDEQWRRNKEEDPELLWQFFGSQTGIMRNYPASVWKEDSELPDLYDVRRRPWYTQGISSPKDMLILVDTSGSTEGQALKMIKLAAISALDSLGEDDFVNVIHFAEEAKPVVQCFETFVQANHWNKEILREFILGLKANAMASYTIAFDFAFKQFEKLDQIQNRTDGVGAMCNKIIMFLTDGGSEMPEEVFQKYNSDQSVRIFSYAVGPTASPIEAVRWIACQNKGFFYKIPAMGAIRSTVQGYVSSLSRPIPVSIMELKYSDTYRDQYSYNKYLAYGLAESQMSEARWTLTYADNLGLGMMTTVTMPVYNRTMDASNQTILGVMGTDVTVAAMENFTQTRQLGPNGYVMALNTNGYMLMHPDLKAKFGYVSDPVNVDLLDIEYATPEKEEMRRHMIDGLTGTEAITTIIYAPDQKHIDNRTRVYYYTNIPDSTFSLSVVAPTYSNFYFAGRTDPIPMEQGLNSLRAAESAIIVAPWNHCPDFELPENETLFDEFVQTILGNSSGCDVTLLQHLFTDVNVTQDMLSVWETVYNGENNGIFAFITATNAGMTRIYPANASQIMEDYEDPWEAIYYKRTFDHDHWIYSAPFSETAISTNSSMPLVLASKAVKIKLSGKDYIPGVIGGWVEQDRLREIMFEREPLCAELDVYSCYFVDDGGFLILSNSDDDSYKVGLFFGDHEVEPVLMDKLVNISVFLQNVQYDYQATCQVTTKDNNAAPSLRSLFAPLVFDVMSVSWWTSKLTWSWLNMEIVQWLFSSPEHYAAYSAPVPTSEPEEYTNISCVQRLAQYTFNSGDKTEYKSNVVCENCTRTYATSRMKASNLLFVMVEKDCGGFCQLPEMLQAPKKVDDPNLVSVKVDKKEECGLQNVQRRYRKRPSCYDSNPNEDSSQCSSADKMTSSLSLLAVLFISWLMIHSGTR